MEPARPCGLLVLLPRSIFSNFTPASGPIHPRLRPSDQWRAIRSRSPAMAYRSRPVQIRSAVPLSIRAPKDRAVRLPGRTRSHSRPYAPDPLHHPYLRNECYSAFRRPLQFIVMSVTVVMDGTFPIPIGFLHDGELVAYPRASRH